MNFESPIVWVILGGIVVAIVVGLLASHFSSEAKMERRRRKSNSPVVSKERRPMIKFSVHTKKPKR
jgi:hypothetical protein